MPPSLKVTVPVGVPPVALTAAVNATAWPAVLGFCDDVSAVVVVADRKANRSAADVAEVPPAVVTVTSTVPLPVGDVAVIEVAELMMKAGAFNAPNFTAVAPVKPVPVIETDVPPAAGPDVGAIDDTAGAGVKVNWSAADVADVPPGVVTVTSSVPVPAGEVAVIEVAEFTVKPVALVAPNFTAVAPVKLVPVSVTDVPPVAGPDAGETEVTVGVPK